MYVLKRNGTKCAVSFDKIMSRIQKLCYGLDVSQIDPVGVAQKVIAGLYEGVSTKELDTLTSSITASMASVHPDYEKLAARISISNLHKETKKSFSELVKDLYIYVHPETGKAAPLVSQQLFDLMSVKEIADRVNSAIIYDRDFQISYFGFKTMERTYLKRMNNQVAERPQHMFMRVALGIHGDDIDSALETYELMSLKYFTHATPTLFNSGTPRPALASCYLISMKGDAMNSIYETLTSCALISKNAGGIGLHVHNIRASGSYISGTGGTSNGLVPMLKVFNATARYCDQGSKRPGAFAIYLEPWHADVFDFIELRKNVGSDELRARDLFYALWIPDLFMKRVEADGDWTLMCPQECPGLSDVHSAEFEKLYCQYEKDGKGRKTVRAQKLWYAILESQVDTGGPFMLYKDACNSKSNQKNLGTIKSSNLCTEIIEYSSPDETAVCLTADTEIMTENGIRRLDKLANEKIISPYDDEKLTLLQNDNYSGILLDNGVRDIYELDILGSRNIKATEDHKFLTCLFDGKTRKMTYEWKKVKDLKIKDRIVTQATDVLESYKNARNNIKEYMTLGWLTGDGHFSDKVTYVCFGKDDDISTVELVTNQLNEWRDKLPIAECGHYKAVNISTDKCGTRSWQSSQASLIKFLKNKGMKCANGPKKTIPDKIKYDASPSEIASFLSALFSADGTVGNYDRAYVSLSSASEKLLEDTQALLRCFGVDSKFVFGTVKSRGSKQGALNIHGAKNIQNFADYIGFNLHSGKQAKLNIITQIIRKNGNKCNSHLTIRNIKYAGKQQVYDIALPKHHTFLAEGLVTHNCNLVSVALPTFVDEKQKSFDFEKLRDVMKVVTKNLNNVVNVSFYPTKEAEKSNLRHRPIGIGVQGLADVFMMLKIPYESDEAKALNKRIFEHMYFWACWQSMELSQKHGPYDSYMVGNNDLGPCPAAQGILQPDLWGLKAEDYLTKDDLPWDELRLKIKEHGLRNSLLLAPMPTATSSQLLGYTESFEPLTSNIYVRRVTAGEFQVVNKYLLRDLLALKLWDKEGIMKSKIIRARGSIQNIPEIPSEIKSIYKTVWEISQKNVIDMAADRGAFIDQSQSMNLYIAQPNFGKMTSMYFYGWKKGLKTGQYYHRSLPAADGIKFTVSSSEQQQQQPKKVEAQLPTKTETQTENETAMLCSLENKEACMSCSS